jgi:flap endonuclease-1
MELPDRRQITDAVQHVAGTPKTIPTYFQPHLSPPDILRNDVNSITTCSQTCLSGSSEFEQAYNTLSSQSEQDLPPSTSIMQGEFREADFQTSQDVIFTTIMDSVPPAEDVISALSSLYQEYRDCVARITSLPSTMEIPESPDETRAEYIMSRSQLQMTIEEGRIWDALADAPETALASLAEKSGVLSESYARRSSPPTTQTYEESKEILRAMGVPCIESEGPFEAEALASSLVIHGIADYVASEDTVLHFKMTREPLFIHHLGRPRLRGSPHPKYRQ